MNFKKWWDLILELNLSKISISSKRTDGDEKLSTNYRDNDTESSIPFYSQPLEIVIILPFLFITS